jgi:hypothetical protein
MSAHHCDRCVRRACSLRWIDLRAFGSATSRAARRSVGPPPRGWPGRGGGTNPTHAQPSRYVGDEELDRAAPRVGHSRGVAWATARHDPARFLQAHGLSVRPHAHPAGPDRICGNLAHDRSQLLHQIVSRAGDELLGFRDHSECCHATRFADAQRGRANPPSRQPSTPREDSTARDQRQRTHNRISHAVCARAVRCVLRSVTHAHRDAAIEAHGLLRQ